MKILSKISQLDECVLQNSYHMENRVYSFNNDSHWRFFNMARKGKIEYFFRKYYISLSGFPWKTPSTVASQTNNYSSTIIKNCILSRFFVESSGDFFSRNICTKYNYTWHEIQSTRGQIEPNIKKLKNPVRREGTFGCHL